MMKRLIPVIMLLCATAAQAKDKDYRLVAMQPSPPYNKSTLELIRQPYGADLIFTNELTGPSCCDTFQLNVTGVTVVVEVDTSGPPDAAKGANAAEYFDIVRVISVSDGMQAVPEEIMVDEKDFGVIQIMPGMS